MCIALCVLAAGRVASVMVAAGVLPAMEQLLRQVPVVSPAHVTGAVLLVSCGSVLWLYLRCKHIEPVVCVSQTLSSVPCIVMSR